MMWIAFRLAMLKSLKLENFRNYRKLRFDFEKSAGITYLIGDNGQGKTNLLEAIYMLALSKSFRIADEEGLIAWGAEFGRIKGQFNDVDERRLEIFLGRAPQPRKAYKINGVETSASNFLGQVRVVFFHPEDLNMLYLGPDLRRRYLDILIIQKSRVYFMALRKFKRLKEQRNALLTSIRDRMAGEEDLDVWDNQMVEAGAVLWRERASALAYINNLLSENYTKVSGHPAEIGLQYINSLGLDFAKLNETDNLEELYREELWKSRQRDIASGHTQRGPHRDDIEFNLNGRPILTHASRGEFRTILLALKLIEMEFFSEDGALPILLLDDVFSELDHDRQRFLLEHVVNFQTFIATTKDSAIINRDRLLAGDLIEVAGGKAQTI